uniref:DUF5801 repeats-in-toxin domain-containing protein n=1 Tax=Aminobacter niigataensis TaxID=83265 RepID=UPI0028524F8E|nr:DUF5801 repeats-in-toxin domain-containing protein [Aminobacter niigataensis]WMD00576.1 DUF5801 repeats-in-toxin domain-containing protein [Aminobacter niigataensis]
MATSVDQGNLSATATGSDPLLDQAVPLSEVQLLAQATEPAAKADPVPVDAGSGQPIQAAQPNATPAAPATAAEYTADASNVVHLPANISVDNIKVDGKNLILEQADGTEIVVKDAASNVPTFMLGDVELPRVALIAALEAGGVDVAFGPDGSISVGPGSANSSGGNFEAPIGGIGNGFDLSALLPPTALQFPQYEYRELFPGARRNRAPEMLDFAVRVSEEGLQNGIKDDSGSSDTTDQAIATGPFSATDADGDPLSYTFGVPSLPAGMADLYSGNDKIEWIGQGTSQLIGMANGLPIITITATGDSYSIVLSGPINHPIGGSEDDLTLVIPVTVSDGKGGTATANMSVTIEDDGPSVTGTVAASSVTLDETNARQGDGSGFGAPINATSAAAIISATLAFGADDAAASGATVYGIELTGGGTSALTSLQTAIGDFPITLVETAPNTIVGQYTDGGIQTAFTIVINADGTLTVTQNVALEHTTDGSSPADHDDALSLSGLITATVTITDSDGDTASGSAQIGGAVTFKDDGPSVTGTVAASSVTLDETNARQGDGSGFGAPINATSAAAIISATLAFGADDAAASGATVYGIELTGGGTSALTSLQTAIGDFPITLVETAPNTIVGQYTDGGIQTAFTIVINADGTLTVTQNVALEHTTDGSSPADHDDALSLSGLITATVTITDSDGDTASGSAQIGGAVTFKDDGPSVTGTVAASSVTLDETNARQGDGSGFGAPINATSAAAIISATLAFGADDAAASGATVYGIELTGGGTSALTSLQTAIGDFPITLVETAPNTIVGQYTDGGIQTAFTIVINADGTLTVTQNVALEHTTDGSSPADHDDALSLSGLITATVTITDSDGDTASGSAQIGGAVTFKDDGPSVTGTVAASSVTLDETNARQGDGSGFGAPINATSAAAIISATLAFGADDAAASGATVYGIELTGGGTSALTSLQTAIGDFPITLVETAPNTIVGQYTDGGIQTAFTIVINADGTLTVTQNVALEHTTDGSSPADHDDALSLSGLITATVTITDSDGDTASGSAQIGGAVTFKDDGPSVTGTVAASSVTLDETNARQGDGSGFGAPINATSAAAIISATLAFGADDAAASGATVYGIELTGGGTSALTSLQTAIGDFPITLVETAPNTIVGQYTDGGIQTAFTIVINADGTLTVTQNVALEHTTDGSSPADHDDALSLSGLITATVTITDSDGDTASGSAQIGGAVTFKDDGPSVTGTVAASSVTLDETNARQGDGSGFGAPINATSAAAIISATLAFGADDAAASGATVYGIELTGGGTSALTSLQTAIGDFPITLVETAPNTIVGQYTDGGIQTAFTIVINADGTLTVTQNVALEHTTDGSSPADHDDALSLSGLITATVTITDSDGDTASGSAQIGGAVTFKDDGPSVTGTVAASSVTLDETNARQGDGSGFGAPINATSAAAIISATLAFGADDAAASGATVYGIELTGGGTSALTSLQTAIGDFPITLVETAPNTIVGQYTDGGIQTAFTIVINADGTLTVTQNVALEHTTDGSSPADHDDALSLSGLITATVTITDSDGDTASGSAQIGGAVTFKDDGPSVTGTVAASSVTLDETNARQGDGSGFGAPINATSAAAIISATLAFGADDAAASGATVYGIELTGGGTSALTSLQTAIGDFPITLVETAPNTIVGQYTDGGIQTAFTIVINADGTLTVTQNVALEHTTDGSSPADHDDALSLSGLITATVTITDSDGDTASGSAQIGGAVTFKDDGPSVTGTVAASSVTLDETNARQGDGSGFGAPINATSAAAIISATLAFGADDAAASGATVYGIELTGGGTSALTSLQTAIGDFPITLVETAPNTIVGQYTDGGIQTAFTIVINADGTLTVTQNVALEHTTDGSSPADHDDALSLSGLITATVTITDSDGDTASGSAQIGGAVTFKDDGPSVTGTVAASSVTLDETNARQGDGSGFGAPINATSAAAIISATLAFGADDAAASGATVYGIELTGGGTSALTSLQTAIGDFPITLVETAPNTIVGQYTDGGIQTAFTIVINADGTLTVTQNVALEHTTDGSSPADHDDALSLSGLITATVTITDSDGDTASGSAQIGGAVTFKDDGPSVTGTVAASSVTLDETNARQGDGSGFGAPINATSAAAIISATLAFGADDAAASGATVYGIELTGGGTSALTSLQTAIGDFPITLVETAPNTIVGQYTDGGIQTAFTIVINADGTLTVTQNVALEHTTDGSSPADHDDALSLSGLITATVTITDSDGDTASGSAQIGGAVTFKDDGPSVTGTVAASSVTLDETNARQGDGSGFGAPINATSAAAIISATLAFGADDAAASGATVYGIELTGGGTSALTSLQTAIGDFPITLVETAPNTIVGQYTDGGIQTAFTIVINADGTLTVTQNVALEHTTDGSSPADHDDALSLSGLITATVTITDSDGDTASGSAQIGGAVTFKDDGPSVTGTVAASSVTLDETNARQGDGSGFGAPINATSAAAIISATLAFGADDAAASGATVYGIELTGGGTSALTSLQTAIGDFPITLVETAPNTIVGQYTDGGIQTAFTIVINADGTLTVTQNVALEHTTDGSSPADHDDALSLSGLITATVTITDSDGDTASGSAQIGGAVTFKDDGPSVTGTVAASSVTLDETNARQGDGSGFGAPINATSAAAIISATLAFGADDAAASGATVYGIELTGGGTSALTSLQTAIGDFPITLVETAPNTIVGQYTDGGIQTAFTIVINADGTLTVTQNVALEHTTDGSSPADHDDALSLSGLITATVTITDSDGDTASGSAQIGGAVTFKDDGPSVTGTVAASSVTLDETNARQGDGSGFGAPINATSAAAIISATLAFGADDAAASGATVYGIELTGGGTSALTSLQTAIGDFPITLVETAPNTIVGQYTDGGIQTAFTIVINADGTLTVTQNVALEHTTDGSSPADHDDALSLSGLITATVTITDSDGDTASGSAQIGGAVTFKDDGPSVQSVQDAVVANTTGSITGAIDISYGADGPDAGSALFIAGYDDLPGIVEVLSADGQTLTAYIDSDNDGVHDAGETSQFYQLTLNDTENTYTLTYSERPTVSIPLNFAAASGGGGDETLTVPAGDYTLAINGGIFNGTTLVDLGEGDPGDDDDDVKPTGTGFGIGGTTGQTTIENNEGFTISVSANGSPSTADALTFEIDRNGGGGTTTMVVNWRAYDADGNVITGGTGYNAGSGSQTFTVIKSPNTGFITINPPGEFATMEIWFTNQTGSGNVRIEGVDLITTVIPENQPLTFDIGARDGDGDVSNLSNLEVLLQGGAGPGYTVNGTSHGEILAGGSAADTISGGDGDDTLIGGAGNDQLNGGAGNDTASYEGSNVGVTVTVNGAASGGHATGDTLSLIENLTGSSFTDTLTGDAGANLLAGRGGNDTLIGGAGNDVLDGGLGQDTMTGGDNADTFVISADTIGAINDIITDFNIAQGDQIDLSELLKGLAAGTDLEAGGYVKIEQTGVNTSTVSVDIDGGGNSYQAVAELQNLSYNSATTDTVKILFEDNSGTKHTDNV